MAYSSLARQVVCIVTCCFVFSSISLGTTSLAQAQSLAEARALFERGNRELQSAQSQRGARKRASLERALDAYVESLRIARNRNVLFNTAVTLEALGRDTEAFNYYQEFLQFEDLQEDKRSKAKAQLEKLTERVGVVSVRTTPLGANVRMGRSDTPSLGRTPLEVAVEPGAPTTLLIDKKGFEGAERTITLERGASTTIEQPLQVLAVPLTVHAPGMVVELDGKPIEEGKPTMQLPGEHLLRVNMGRIERTITIEPGEPLEIDLRGTAVGAAPAHFEVRASRPVTAQLDGALIARGKQTFSQQTEAGRHRLRLYAPGIDAAEASFSLAPGHLETIRVTEEDIATDETTLEPWPAVFWVATGVAAAGTAALQLNYWLQYQDNQDDPSNESTFDNAEDARLWGNLALGATAALGITALTLTLLDEQEVRPALRIRIGATPVNGGAVLTTEVRQ